jgi:hypothetical protein
MRYRPIQAASRERVPITLWRSSRIRTGLAVLAASAAALVPAVAISSPALAVNPSNVADLTVSDGANWEGGKITFTLTYTGTAAADFTLATAGSAEMSGTATGGTDYTATPSRTAITMPAATAGGSTTATVTVTTLIDGDNSPNQTFQLIATDNQGSPGTTYGTGTIWELGATTFTLTGSSTYPETAITSGNTTTQRTVTVTAQLSGAVAHDVVIPVATVDNTAVSTGGVNRDYTALPTGATITIPTGQVTGTVDVSLYDDSVDEASPQDFSVAATGTPLGAAAFGGSQSAVIYITDDDSAPTVSIGTPLPATEGTPLGFPVTLSNPSEQAITVDFVTSDGTNTATSQAATSAGLDYTPVSRLLATPNAVSIPAYNKSVMVYVPTLADVLVEGPENLKATISNPVNTTLGTPTTATGIINDEDAGPTVALTGTASTNFNETDADHNEVITVTVTGSSTIPVKVDYSFVGGTATNGVDYVASDGSLTFPAPVSNGAALTIPIKIIGDTKYEGTGETVKVALSSSTNSLGAATTTPQTLTILETGAEAAPMWSVGDVSVDEGNTGSATARVPITLTGANNVDTTFNVVLADDTATNAGTNSALTPGVNDYDAPLDGTVTIAAGQLTGYLDVPINGDTVFEGDEKITVTPTLTAGGISGSTPVTGQHASKVTIKNDDAKPYITFNQGSGSEGSTLRVTPTLVGMSQYTYTVGLNFSTYGTGNTAATPTTDYDAPTTQQTYVVAPGTTGVINSLITNVYLVPDDIDEATEAFQATATEVSQALTGFTTSTGVYKINDDQGDLPPAASVEDESIGEWEKTVDVHVNLAFTGDATSTTQTVSIPYWTVDGSAKAGEDYKATKGTLEVPAGTLATKISVPVLDDKVKEGNENFFVKLGTPSPTGAAVTRGTGEVVIKDNDKASAVAPTISAPAKLVGAGSVPITGKASPKTKVEVWGAPVGDDELKYITSTMSDDEGDYKFSRPITQGYKFATQAEGVNSRQVTVQVQQDPAFSAVSTAKGTLALSITGDPRGGGQSVVVQRLVNGKWTDTGWKGTTSGNNPWKTTSKVAGGTVLTLRASVAGNASMGTLTGYSDAVKVTIKK